MSSSLRLSWFRVCVEILFIIFPFYSNLLMGEFTVQNGGGKTWSAALTNIFTEKKFWLALVCAGLGFVVFEALRKRATETLLVRKSVNVFLWKSALTIRRPGFCLKLR